MFMIVENGLILSYMHWLGCSLLLLPTVWTPEMVHIVYGCIITAVNEKNVAQWDPQIEIENTVLCQCIVTFMLYPSNLNS